MGADESKQDQYTTDKNSFMGFPNQKYSQMLECPVTSANSSSEEGLMLRGKQDMKIISLTPNNKIPLIFCSLFLAVLFIILPLSSRASLMPDFVRLSPVTENISAPVGVALDPDGRLYVAESSTNSVAVLSQSGKFISKLTGLALPISVAVDSIGRIFVGSKKKGNVEVYDSEFNQLFKLGSGDGEFVQPNDIAIDALDNIYVVDKGKDIVRIYDADGQPVRSFGSSGNGNGQFHHPVSIAIDEAADGEIIVLDRQLVAGTLKEGARIQFFAMDGTFLRSFTKNGDQTGGMVRPQLVTVDNASRIYVTDSFQNSVMVYDNVGAFLGAVFDVVNPLRTPLGITIGKTNRLYVASRLTKRIEVYGIDQYTRMNVDPLSLTFEALEGGDNPAPQTVSVFNNGRTVISWASVSNDSWISLSEVGGVADLGQTVTLDAAVDVGGLAAGEYKGSFSISAGISATETVNVTLKVEPSPILSVSPATLNLTSEVGDSAPAEIVTIANEGSKTLIWNISADQQWISFNNGSGGVANSEAAPDEETMLADTSLGAGTYTGTITVTGEGAFGSPATIGVTLTLTEPPVPPEEGPTDPPTPEERVLDNMTWTLKETVPGINFNDVWGSSISDVYVIGNEGTILKYDGAEWSSMDSSTNNHLLSVWGSSDTDVYAVGKKGIILHYDGSGWSSVAYPTKKHFYGVWGSSETDVYAVGHKGTILHYDATGWGSIKAPTQKHLHSVWGSSASDVYAVGQQGTIIHYDGTEWSTIISVTDKDLFGVWGSSASDVYAVGEDGTILYYDGVSWSESTCVTAEHLLGVWGSSGTDVFVVGEAGVILYNDDSGFQTVDTDIINRLNGVWGSSLTTDVFAVGANGVIVHGKNE